MNRESKRELVGQLVEHLRVLSPDGLPQSWFVNREMCAVPSNDETVDAGGQTSVCEPTTASSEKGSFQSLDIAELEQLALGCTGCRLATTRKKVVFGTGSTNSPLIVFVGEGPGADEDRQGEPFVGKAGALLSAAITKGLGMNREDVYICNVVKCRPPQNRTPLPDEVDSCTPYLFRQLEVLSPRVIVTLGAPAQSALSGVKMGITKLRGKWLDWRGIRLMPTFHPAYILRNPSAKRLFWQDLQEVMRELGLSGQTANGSH